MKYTREILLDLSKDLVAKRFENDQKVDAVFLLGSVRPEDAQIDHPTDVDLLVLHNGDISRERELVKISPDYHFDIFFEETSMYNNPKELRSDGWRGWAMWDPCLLHQKGRFFEYTQSILRSQFDEPKNIIARAKHFSASSRQQWESFTSEQAKTIPKTFLKAVYNAANAFACLARPPYTKRYFLSQFFVQATEMDATDLITSLLDCICETRNPDIARKGIQQWEHCYSLATQAFASYTIHPLRQNYYLDAITSQAQSEFPAAALWPYTFTWAYISEESQSNKEIADAWTKVSRELGYSPTKFPDRLHALDLFLEQIEDIIQQVSDDYGVD